MVTQNEMHRWTNLLDWSDIYILIRIDVHLNMIEKDEQLKRLLFEIEKAQSVLKVHFTDFGVRNIQFLIIVMDWLMAHANHVESLGFDLIFTPLIIEDWIIQIDAFETFIVKFVECAAQLYILKHLKIKVDLKFLHLPDLMEFFSQILHRLAHPKGLESLQLGFTAGTFWQPWQDNYEYNYYNSQKHFENAFSALTNLREFSLKLDPLERCPHHEMAYTQLSTGQTCFIEEELSHWISYHQYLRVVYWEMHYVGIFDLIPIILILNNPLLKNLTAILNGRDVNIYLENPTHDMGFYHEMELTKLGQLIKHHAHLDILKLDFSFEKIQYINQHGDILGNISSYIHAKIVDLFIRPISQNQFLKDLSLNFGKTYQEVQDLFFNNTTLVQFEFKFCPGLPQLLEHIRQNVKGLESVLDNVIGDYHAQFPRKRTEQALEIISPREIHRIDHLLWVRAMPAFICLQRNALEEMTKLPKHSYYLARLIMSMFIGDLTSYRLGPDVCMYIAIFLDCIPDMFQLQLMQGGILRRGLG